MTNDDGIESLPFQNLLKELIIQNYGVIVLAPAKNHSATGMKINLGKHLEVCERKDIVEKLNLDQSSCHIFELHGTPCDTIIAALDGGLSHLAPGITPRLVISGINIGPNLSQDCYHSGTIAAAREAGLYGMPAIATSWSSFDETGVEFGIKSTLEIVNACMDFLPTEPSNLLRKNIRTDEHYLASWPHNSEELWREDPISVLRNAFSEGDLMLNVNTPPDWNGDFQTTRLGMRWYRNAVKYSPGETNTFLIGAAEIEFDSVLRSDCDADSEGYSSVSCLPTWPQTHPLNIDPSLLSWCLENSSDGLPVWLKYSNRNLGPK